MNCVNIRMHDATIKILLDVYVTVHHQYNDVNNQQDATTFSFINLFKSVQHVSGDKFSGALFDLIYSFWYNVTTLLPTGATVEMETFGTVI